MIKFQNVTVAAANSTQPNTTRTLLSEVNLNLTEQEITVIGANGSGKSTLLQLTNGLLRPTTGAVTTSGKVGFVFSNPLTQLVMPTVLEDVMLSLRKLPKKERQTAALEILSELGLEDLATSSIYELSAGQQQLVAVAVVMAMRPEILVLDEPTTLLDLKNTLLLQQLLKQLVARGVQIIFATHDLDFAKTAARALLLDGGAVIADGDPPSVISKYRCLVRTDA